MGMEGLVRYCLLAACFHNLNLTIKLDNCDAGWYFGTVLLINLRILNSLVNIRIFETVWLI